MMKMVTQERVSEELEEVKEEEEEDEGRGRG